MLEPPAPDDLGPAIDFWRRPRSLRPACRVCAGLAEAGPDSSGCGGRAGDAAAGSPAVPALRFQAEAARRTALAWDLKARRSGRMVRVLANSLEEFWEEGEGFSLARRGALQLMRGTPHLAWMLLTARPEVILGLLHTTLEEVWSDASLADGERVAFAEWIEAWLGGRPPANVWLGTVMGQAAGADGRIQALLKVPAAVRFLSCSLGCPKVVSASTRGPRPKAGRTVRRWKHRGAPSVRFLGPDGIRSQADRAPLAPGDLTP